MKQSYKTISVRLFMEWSKIVNGRPAMRARDESVASAQSQEIRDGCAWNVAWADEVYS